MIIEILSTFMKGRHKFINWKIQYQFFFNSKHQRFRIDVNLNEEVSGGGGTPEFWVGHADRFSKR